jgi:hypothetical protein
LYSAFAVSYFSPFTLSTFGKYLATKGWSIGGTFDGGGIGNRSIKISDLKLGKFHNHNSSETAVPHSEI